MSEILIRGMEMPKTCSQCPIFNFDYGICNDLSTHNRDFETSIIDGCPLVELPEHGDLIDRNEIKTNMIDEVLGKTVSYVNMEQIKNAPVIVPSNKEEE